MKLTQRRIEDIKCPAGKKDVLVFDEEQRGLGVRVTAAGSKTYLAQYTLGGIKRRVPLGSCSAISLAAARDAVRAILGDVAKGKDPAADRKTAAREAQRKAADEALTLEALVRQWEALRLADKRERYAAEAVRALRYAFTKHLNVPAGTLDRSTIVRVLDNLTKEGKTPMASRTAAYGRACYQWAIKRGSLDSNPFTNLPLTPIAKRERVLTDAELAAVWKATDDPGPFNAIVRMLILTGQRREEVDRDDLGGNRQRSFDVDHAGEPREEWRRAYRPALASGASDLARRAACPRNRSGLPRPDRPFQRFQQGQGSLGQGQRRQGLALA